MSKLELKVRAREGRGIVELSFLGLRRSSII
jgi:hypothetical protein